MRKYAKNHTYPNPSHRGQASQLVQVRSEQTSQQDTEENVSEKFTTFYL